MSFISFTYRKNKKINNQICSPFWKKRKMEISGSSSQNTRVKVRKAKLKWTHHHVVVFFLTFFCYAFFHVTKKVLSCVKNTLSAEWTPHPHNVTTPEIKPDELWSSHYLFATQKEAEPFLGILDTINLFTYAVGLYVAGIIGDRYDLRMVLANGMWMSAVLIVLFGTVSEWLQLYNVYFYGVVWGLNGLVQSLGWPAVVAVMGNWFGRSSRGFILGLWSSCASVGNIMGTFLVSSVLQYGYEYAFLTAGAVLFCGGIVILFGLVPSPRELGLPEPEEEESPDAHESVQRDSLGRSVSTSVMKSQQVQLERPEAIGFFKAFCLPGVLAYSVAYACLKMVNYSLFFWLPFYLDNKFHWSQAVADNLSVWYDVGGIIGGIVGGVISDRTGRRTPTVFIMLLLSLPAMYGYSISPPHRVVNAVLMTVAGLFTGGAANLISAAVCADLGRQGGLAGNAEALSTVTGIVDGTGSTGAALGQVLVPLIQLHYGWNWVFLFFMLMCLLTLVCLLPVFVREIREICAPYSSCCRPSSEPRYQHISDDSSVIDPH